MIVLVLGSYRVLGIKLMLQGWFFGVISRDRVKNHAEVGRISEKWAKY